MRKLYIPRVTDGTQIKLTDENHTYVKDVLKLKRGDKLTVCDGSNEYAAVIAATKTTSTILDIVDITAVDNEPKVDVTLFIGLLPQDELTALCEKATELGVKAIVPFLSVNSKVKQEDVKTSAVNRAVRSAAAASGRGFEPPVYAAVEFSEMMSLLKSHPVRLFFSEAETRGDLKKHVRLYKKEKKIALIVGPPAGFSLKEAEKLRTLCDGALTLGVRLFKPDTAAVAALCSVLYEYGEFGSRK